MLRDMENQSLKTVSNSAPTIIMGIVSGLCIAIAITSYHAYFVTKTGFEQLRLQGQRLMQRSLLLYGDVESVDRDASTATIRFRNQFVAAEDPVLLTVHISPETKIVQESLIGINGAYSALSDATDRTFEDIVPGMRVAALLENVPDEQRIEAQVIFFGNPL